MCRSSSRPLSRAQAPLIDKLLKEVGLPGGDVNSLSGGDLQKLLGLGETSSGGGKQLDMLDDTEDNPPSDYRN
jgi:hypothetical protein